MPVRLAVPIAIVLLVPLFSGCIANMGELKEALGAVEPPPPAPVVHDPPMAVARAERPDALVGEPIRFTSAGSADPQSFPLVFGWDFGDGARAEGAAVSHAFATPGEHTVTLRAVSTAGLAAEDTVRVRILSPDRAPAAAFRVLDAGGASVLRANAGDALLFDAAASSDPEGAPLLHLWSFGDGATSADAAPTHAYAAPGSYEATLVVQDRAGLRDTTRARLAIDAAWHESGAFEPMGEDSASFAFTVADIRAFTATLAFPAQAGLASLQLVLKDASGQEIARTDEPTATAAQGEATRTIELGAREISDAAKGAWTLEVVRESGVGPEFALDVVALA